MAQNYVTVTQCISKIYFKQWVSKSRRRYMLSGQVQPISETDQVLSRWKVSNRMKIITSRDSTA